jgi:hypothetical protein
MGGAGVEQEQVSKGGVMGWTAGAARQPYQQGSSRFVWRFLAGKVISLPGLEADDPLTMLAPAMK